MKYIGYSHTVYNNVETADFPRSVRGVTHVRAYEYFAVYILKTDLGGKLHNTADSHR